ncbi:MAG: L,D-transpeptidase family protein [Phycisphaerales bacterium]
MTASTPSSRPVTGRTSIPTPQGSSRAAAHRARGMRSLFIAVAALGLGGAAAGWYLTHKSEQAEAPGATAGAKIQDPLLKDGAPGISGAASDGAGTTPVAGATPAAGTPAAPATTPTGVNSATTKPEGGLGSPALTGTTTANDGALRVKQATAMIESDPVRARAELTQLLDGGTLSAFDRQAAYAGINRLAEKLFFSPKIVPGDSVSQSYVVKRGDSLAKIARAEKLAIDWRFVQRINGLASERALHPDMPLKLAHGPFDAEVIKSEFRFNVYAGAGAERVMVASFPCGLGTNDSTPLGVFKVRTGSKLVNPEWRNPRTGEHYAANDPKNPIGERWIGLQGTTAETAKFTGYGIHGTTEPESIGRQMSMGCVRLGDAEVQVVYELIGESSTITIKP